MQLAKRTDRGWIVKCDCAAAKDFTVRSLGIAVECPRCGRTALSTELSTAYWAPTVAKRRRATHNGRRH